MNALADFFADNSEFREFVPYVGGDLELKELSSSAIGAGKQLQAIITESIWERIRQEPAGSYIKTCLRVAFGNLIMFKSIIFTLIAKRMSGGADVYKNEMEAMRRQYIDNYYSAMDSLIRELETNAAYRDEWMATAEYRLIEKLKIKTAGEFNTYYAIDTSYLFFFRTMPIQSEALDDVLGDYFRRIAGREEDFEARLKRALAMLVVAIALTRFDITELPPTIKNLFDDQKGFRHASSEASQAMLLAARLKDSAMNILLAVDTALQEPASGSVDSNTSFNSPDDKIFLMA